MPRGTGRRFRRRTAAPSFPQRATHCSGHLPTSGCSRHGAQDDSVEANFERGAARVGADRRVHMRQWGACGTKRPFRCARRCTLMCLAVLQLWHSRRSAAAAPEHSTVDGSDPPGFDASIGIAGGLACAHPCHPPPGVAPLQQSLAGRPSSAAASAAYQRIRPPVTAFHQLGGSASRPSEVGVGARPSPKLPRGG